MKVQCRFQIIYKYLFIYSCLILHTNAAKLFSTPNSRSSVSGGRTQSSVGTTFRSGSSPPNIRSDLRFSNQPFISIADGKKALSSGSNIPVGSFSALGSLQKQPLNNLVRNPKPMDQPNASLNKYSQQPAYNPFFNPGTYVNPNFPTTKVGSNVVYHQQNFSQGSLLNGKNSSAFLPNNFYVQKTPRKYDYNKIYNPGMNNVSTFSGFNISSNQSDFHKGSHTNVGKPLTAVSGFSKGWTAMPNNSINATKQNLNRTDNIHVKNNLSDEKGYKQDKGNGPLRKPFLLGLKGYTIAAIHRHNLLKSEQVQKEILHQKQNLANTQILVIIMLAMFIVITLAVILFINLRKK